MVCANQEYHHTDVYKRIDTDLEAFFYKREYNLENFNFMVNLLGHQNKLQHIPQVISKMELMKISPDERTHNYMIKAAAMQNDTLLAEAYFRSAVESNSASIQISVIANTSTLLSCKPT